jgi:hypothetical protein
MSKTKELILDHKGYTINGTVQMELWGGNLSYIDMAPVFIPNDQFTHNTLKRSINDNKFGCKTILSAIITISDTYGKQHVTVVNRSFTLNSKQCFNGTKGIPKSEKVYR